MNEPINAPGHGKALQPAIIVYVLYGVGVVVPFAALAGVVYAYVERGKDPVLDSHLTFQIRTFWWGLLWVVAAFILMFVLVGFLVGLVWLVWLAVRIITGIQLAQDNKPVTGTEAMGFKAV